MSRVGRTVAVESVVGITVVGNNNHLIVVCLGSLYGIFHAVVDCRHRFLDSLIDTGMAYHITVGVVNHDEVVFFRSDSVDEFVFHLVSAHFGLKVVGSHLRRRHEDAIFVVERRFAAAVEEECHVGILFGFGDVKLSFAV